MSDRQTVLVTSDESIADAVLSAAAALAVPIERVTSATGGVDAWALASCVLVGVDVAEAMAGLGLRPRAGVFVVGAPAGRVAHWSVPLGGQVIVLPEGLSTLSAVLADDRGRGAPIVPVLGGSGGVGASTLAVGLACAARRRGLRAALVDLDPLGGGLDLLVGAEREPGWRWSGLLGARGEVSDVRRLVPQVDGLSVLALSRPALGHTPELPGDDAVRSVLGSLARHHDLVVVDPGRGPWAPGRAALSLAQVPVLVSGAGVRAVASSLAVLARVERGVTPLLAVRRGDSHVPPDAVGRALGLAVASVLPEDRRLPRLAEQGDPAGRWGRGRWARAVDALVATIVEGRDGH